MRAPTIRTCLKVGIFFCIAFLLFLANLESCTTSVGGEDTKVASRRQMQEVHMQTVNSADLQQREDCMASLSEQEEQHRNEVMALRSQINSLKLELKKHTEKVEQIEEPERKMDNKFHEADQADLVGFIQQQMAKIDIRRPVHDEYEVVPFQSLTSKLVYSVQSDLSRKPGERPKGDKKEDLVEAVYFAIDVLKAQSTAKELTIEHFVDGVFRTDKTTGTFYHFIFKDPVRSYYHSIEVLRPFAPLQRLRTKVIDTDRVTVNIIIPLSGRIDKFRTFLDRFQAVCIENQLRVFLTVVYFGEDGLEEIQMLLQYAKDTFNFHDFKLVTLMESFSRGRGLQEGVYSWDGPDVLMFFCDVDIAFNKEFIEHCKYHTVPGRTVYYPIVFSLYNPKIVYSSMEALPPESSQFHVHRDTGFWRDFGFGMTCQYRSDFLAIKGFDLDIHGWGGEDVHLYRKYLQSDLNVIRVPDPGIFHSYHPKECNTDLTPEQYRMCIGSKAMTEASHSQLGMLAFKETINMTLFQMGHPPRLNNDGHIKRWSELIFVGFLNVHVEFLQYILYDSMCYIISFFHIQLCQTYYIFKLKACSKIYLIWAL